MIDKNDIVIKGLYWVRLPHNRPDGPLNKVMVDFKTDNIVVLDMNAGVDTRFKDIVNYQISSIDFIERERYL